MDQLLIFDQTPSLYTPPDSTATTTESPHQRDRRREKPQLSCNFCRSRKVRCDRQLPCTTCVSKDMALFCTYTPGPQRKGTVSVGDRIQQLEALVRSLVHQQQQQHTLQMPPMPPDRISTNSPVYSFRGTPAESPQNVSVGSTGGFTPLASVEEDAQLPAMSLPNTKDRATSPVPSEHGSMRLHSHGANYVSSVHWAAVLDSISELKDHYEKEEEVRMMTTTDYVPCYSPGPRLLYEPVQATKAEILASIPARPVVDRMVARYFNTQGVAPAVLSSGQFLQEYESFWQNPAAAPFSWIGLLFSIICLSTQYQQLIGDPEDPDTFMRVHMFRERIVHCLVLGQFTRGGPHVLETMIIYCTSEVFMCKDADIGLWLLLGMLVQLALSLGYHRDPRNFSHISPFAGEMRRRVWAAIVQMDLRLSSQMGLPRLLKSQQCDTAEPRNLLDSDFDETTVELPTSRPESEVTPVLYGLAKNRIDSISGVITDLLADTREHPHAEIMELDRKLQEAEASLPPIFRWQPLSQSFMVPPQIILHRVFLQLAVQRLIIQLHRKYLAPSQAQDLERYEYSRNACVQAAIRILEFQQLVDEETQPDGILHSVRWMLSSLMQSIFLLGMSVLCYYVQLVKTTSSSPTTPNVSIPLVGGPDSGARILDLLRNTYPMWLRLSTASQDARKAVEHLSLLLGLRAQQEQEVAPLAPQDSAIHFDLATPQNVAISMDQVTWDAYQECIANFPSPFDADKV